ncbi:MAG: SDR family oxidoreductase [Candidatus Dadabacteria bacterium]|nr:SDR family oxidoreductase [Candidatus Dadabacteria bacterium]NIQ13768.1 SDR family oxidoreductase [Candidatus Dadabacteria bacterium]
MSLQGKSPIITGGGTGIGKATAILLAQHSAIVLISERKESKFQQDQEECSKVVISAYVATKGAVTQLTRIKYADRGIRVNAGCPGAIWTPMVDGFIKRAENLFEAEDYVKSFPPIGHLGYAGGVAQTVLFLYSYESGFMTSFMLSVDGGCIAT